jgi:hypothetical protein
MHSRSKEACMWNPKLKYDTYQDVKDVLYQYTYLSSLLLSLIAYFVVLPQEHQKQLNTLFGALNDLGIIGVVVTIVFGFIASFILIHMFEVHDKLYDRFIIRWRKRYATDFIIPELFKPLITTLDTRFLDLAKKNLRESMNVFYYFVGDRDTVIRKNLVVRFYESVWKYWATQINEILIIIFSLITAGYIAYYALNDLSFWKLFIVIGIMITLAIGNRFLIKYFLPFVRTATMEEIEDIHSYHMQELEAKTRDLSENLGLGQ